MTHPLAALRALALAAAFALPGCHALAQSAATRHFASNGNWSRDGTFGPARAGFNIADVSGPGELDALPDGVSGLVWVGRCDGADDAFRQIVDRVIRHPKLFGFYLMDNPDPTGRWSRQCKPENLAAQSDWIHARRPDAHTFVALMNLASSAAPSFGGAYRPKDSHVDLFSVAPYPCRLEWTACDYDMIDRYVAAAIAAGIPAARLAPTYQTFGLGAWRTDTGGRYRLPDAEEMARMLRRWKELIPAPVFDYAYSWGVQRRDVALETSAELQRVFAAHNSAGRQSAERPATR